MLPFSLFCPCLCQNANTMLSLQLPMKFGNVVRVETLRYLTKITTLHMVQLYARPTSPPLASAPKFQIRYAHSISLDCHQLYIVIVAKPYAWLQEPCFCSVVIFVNIVRFPPVRYCQISSAIAETALYSRFGRGIGK